MSTFAGRYIKEPSDLLVVATETSQILGFCDGEQVLAKTFAALTDDERAIIVAVAYELIKGAEDTLDSYANRRGYAIPLTAIDSSARDLLAQWIWIGVLQRGGTLSMADAEKQRQAMRDGVLEDIADGKLILTAAMNTATEAPGSHIRSISDATSRDKTGRGERTSREQWSRY